MRSQQFVTALRETTVPDGVRDAAVSNLSTLVTQTCFRTSDGVFHGFEGSLDNAGCCFGSCTHVWNYEAATASLFPTLSRSFREQQFGYSTDAEGRMDFREFLPAGIDHLGLAAADGQMGAIMKLYFDWRLSGDTEWLRRVWPTAKRALEFAWIPGGWDADQDGVMEGVQHCTYDVEFIGPNPLCCIWYLGALRAGQEMARAVGEASIAHDYHRLFTEGRQWIDRNLFNGEFYVQKIGAIEQDKVAKGLQASMGAVDPENPSFQLGNGCLVDQLAGQYFAHIAGLGFLLDPAHIRKTLESIYKYNYKRTLYHHESVQRVFALNDEAGLIICEYPHGKRPEFPMPYFAEVMTGFEYSAATLMIYMGMVSEGVELIENIRRRYDGERRDPWNEAECGYHYARAMASWAAIPALSGFRYDAVEKGLVVKPRIQPRRFSSFWSTGSGWGSFSQHIQQEKMRFSLLIRHGQLTCRSLTLGLESATGTKAAAKLNGRSLAHELQIYGREAVFVFPEKVTLKEDDTLVLAL